MSTAKTIQDLTSQDYKWGFITTVEEDRIPKGLNEDVVRLISAKKGEPEFMLEWRLKAYRHWASLEKAQAEPKWANVKFGPIDYQDMVYYSAPKQKPNLKSLDEIDPEILRTYEKLGIPLEEQKRLAGVAVDAVFDSVSVGTTFKAKLAEKGVIFCSFSEAVLNHPELVKKYLGSVVPYTDNFFAALNSAVFSDGSFVYVPKGVRCPMELSTYFRINASETGQFERTLIVADEGAYVSYLEGCTAPIRDENQLHAAVVELVALDNAQIKYSTVQNWYPGDKQGKGGIYNFVTKRGACRGVNEHRAADQEEERDQDRLVADQRERLADGYRDADERAADSGRRNVVKAVVHASHHQHPECGQHERARAKHEQRVLGDVADGHTHLSRMRANTSAPANDSTAATTARSTNGWR